MKTTHLLILASLVITSTGCPRPTNLVADVTTATLAVDDALVIVECRNHLERLGRTDDRGRAEISLGPHGTPSECVVTVAKPGFSTVARNGADICRRRDRHGKCKPSRYVLEPVTAASASTSEK